MNPSKYQELCHRTECDQDKSRQRFGTDLVSMNGPVRINHAILGLAGEVGELAGAVERWLYYGRPLDEKNVKEEIGDCLWYLALACNALHLDMAQVMEANIAKLKTRYPEKYSDTHANPDNRDLQAEAAAMEEVSNA